MLLSSSTWRQRLQRLAGTEVLIEGQWARLMVLAAFHDLGKFNLGFQAKGRPELGTTAGHVGEALGVLSHSALEHALAPLSTWGDSTGALLVASICHHGKPVAPVPWQKTWWAARSGLDPARGAVELLRECERWFPSAFAAAVPDLPSSTEFEHAFAGLVTFADWLGSSTDFFPYSEEGQGDRMAFARRQATRLAEQMFLQVPEAARQESRGRSAFERVAPVGYSTRPAQRVVLSAPVDPAGSITVLESETGSGKTEAALAHFIALHQRGLVDGLYFALPTRTAATQIFERVLKAVRQAFAQPPPVTLAVPGYLRVDGAIGERVLPGFEVLWPDTDQFRHRAWAAENPKRYLGAAIAVGTIDQLLLSALMVGHAHLRATAVLRHLLVIDEVHASDDYMTRILEQVLSRHLRAGGHALLLSATLGSEARERLLKPCVVLKPPPLEAALTTPYPLVTAVNPSGEISALPVESSDHQKAVRLRTEPWLESPDGIAVRAIQAARAGAAVIVIKNTVNDCIEVQRALERCAGDADPQLFRCNGRTAPHHSRYSRGDRELLDRALEKAFGRHRGTAGCVVVATQTVQQSLDLDADLLITDLCPADVLLQRLGRLHRHQRPRPQGFEQPCAVIAVPRERDLGRLLSETGSARHHHGLGGNVYADLRILEATWRLVQHNPLWTIPAMNRMLVERSVHSAALDAIVKELGGRWESHQQAQLGARYGMRRHAQLNLVDWSTSYAETRFPSDLDRRISTRLGEGDRRVVFPDPMVGPFGAPVSELVLRPWWVSAVTGEDHVPSAVAVEDGACRFRFGERWFLYDRLGLRPERSPTPTHTEVEDDGP